MRGKRVEVKTPDGVYSGYQYQNGFYIFKKDNEYWVYHGLSECYVLKESLPRKKFAVEALKKFTEELTKRFPNIKYDKALDEQMLETDREKMVDLARVTREIWDKVQEQQR